jgi:hypothetical protein
VGIGETVSTCVCDKTCGILKVKNALIQFVYFEVQNIIYSLVVKLLKT